MKYSLPQLLQENIGLHPSQFERLIRRAPDTYKHYTIKKRTGGDRWIAQPAKETKYIQHWLIDNIFLKFPVHRCAMAYKAGTSIAINAAAHSKNSYLAKFDFSNFFNSIKYHNVNDFLSLLLGDSFSPDDIDNMARVSCVREPDFGLCLSVGAPSSPLLSNAILYEFDSRIEYWCQERSIIYTRYADDLTFSTNEKGACSEIHKFLVDSLIDFDCPVLRLNDKKTIHSSKRFQRRVTGLIINNDGMVSLGRGRKREISAMIHKFRCKDLAESESYRLQGLLGFARDAEPSFVESMNKKYGNEILSSIYSLRKPKES